MARPPSITSGNLNFKRLLHDKVKGAFSQGREAASAERPGLKRRGREEEIRRLCKTVKRGGRNEE
jgi:hypothetical protein